MCLAIGRLFGAVRTVRDSLVVVCRGALALGQALAEMEDVEEMDLAHFDDGDDDENGDGCESQKAASRPDDSSLSELCWCSPTLGSREQLQHSCNEILTHK